MDAKAISATECLVRDFSVQAAQSFENKRNQTLDLFNNRKVPEEGWSEGDVELLLHNLSLMDSNNFSRNCGVGERESRFASGIVARRHYRMGHGIGRSGDIAAIQPKAAGSTLVNKLTNEFVLDILKTAGVPSTRKCIVLPMATGMSLTLCLRTLHSERPEAKYVIWSRIDQKSCFKCILTAGLIPVVVNCCVCGGQLVTNTKAIYEAVNNFGPPNIVCVLTTTSCFAPRAPDSIEVVGRICAEYDVPHLVNNAYGIQSQIFMQMIERASKLRVDMYVSSTDKNFMVPVGGSVVAGFCEDLIDCVGQMYPGRASATPSMDVFITLLNIGKKGYKKLLQQRSEMFVYLKSELEKVAKEVGEQVINVPNNQISIGLTLQKFKDINESLVTEIGAMLFSKFVSGTRVISVGQTNNIGGYRFQNWGSHSDDYNCSYLTAAATVGVTKEDIDMFIKRLDETLLKTQKNVVQIVTSDILGELYS